MPLKGERDAGHHETDHQHLVVHTTHEVDDHQRVQHADPQRLAGAGREELCDSGCGPHQQRQPGQHAQAQQHGARHHVVTDDLRDEPRDEQE
ncbi:Uncharacterised protein [Mycobacteroides abscessus subsp. massiliense]|nr:Uncharacterised protein [Mycobacteroides abscessus subsp. massiliense]